MPGKPQHQHETRGRSYTEHSTLLSTPSPSRSAAWRRHHLVPPHKMTVRQAIWTVLRFRSSVQHRSGLQFASYILELSVLTLILVNVVLAISESAAVVQSVAADGGDNSPTPTTKWSDVFLLVSTIIFSIEYALRLWSCVEDERYKGAVAGRSASSSSTFSIGRVPLFTLRFNAGMLCCLSAYSAMPMYHGGLTLRSLRLLRIVSFLRLERMYNAMKNLRVIFARKKEEFLVVSYLTGVVVLTSSLMIFLLEHEAQPTVFSGFGISAWWSVETITSLGYGDIVPITRLGRLLGAVLALWGIVLFTIPGAVLGSGFIEVMLEKQREEEAEMYSLAVGSSVMSGTSLFMGNYSDDETDEHRSQSPAHSPLSGIHSNSATPRMAATFQKMDAIIAGQVGPSANVEMQRILACIVD
ncbi:hypothetical protein BBJ28_00017474 [Nothophytophthora sp. Chile5]|nr:hypothetical protein BBJ28_00017474 [Nothophytophthora sp. Chile5]